MSQIEMDRRGFHQMSLAALTGVIAGVSVGCNDAGKPVVSRLEPWSLPLPRAQVRSR